MCVFVCGCDVVVAPVAVLSSLCVCVCVPFTNFRCAHHLYISVRCVRQAGASGRRTHSLNTIALSEPKRPPHAREWETVIGELYLSHTEQCVCVEWGARGIIIIVAPACIRRSAPGNSGITHSLTSAPAAAHTEDYDAKNPSARIISMLRGVRFFIVARTSCTICHVRVLWALLSDSGVSQKFRAVCNRDLIATYSALP